MGGCDKVFGLSHDECGNGALDLGEECDDGGTLTGDGCGSTCQIEPAFECPIPGSFCLPVAGIRKGAEVTRLPAARGTTGGSSFEHLCGIGDIVIGFEGGTSTSLQAVGSLHAVCGSLGISATGEALTMRTDQSADFGVEMEPPPLSAICAQGTVAVGFVPNISTALVSGFHWTCQQLAHRNGALRFGASEFRDFGPSTGTYQAEQQCPLGAVVTTMFGRAGGLVDALGLGCSSLSTVLCGDGVLGAPETCDDGNVSAGDGCSDRCQRE